MASVSPKFGKLVRPLMVCSQSPFSSGSVASQRFGDHTGSSGWKWEKGGIGMGGKTSGKGTEVKSDTGKGKTYQVPEYYAYNPYSYFDFEKDMASKRLPQPKSGLTEFW